MLCEIWRHRLNHLRCAWRRGVVVEVYGLLHFHFTRQSVSQVANQTACGVVRKDIFQWVVALLFISVL